MSCVVLLGVTTRVVTRERSWNGIVSVVRRFCYSAPLPALGRRPDLACIVNTAACREASETRAVVPEDDAGGGAAVCQEGDMRRRAGGQRPRLVCAALHQRLPIQEDGRTGPSSTRRFSAACTPAAQAHALCARVTQPQALE